MSEPVFGEWLPIETAPKGEMVLLYYPPIPGSRGRQYDHPEMYSVNYAGTTPRQPTHWSPLRPPPPQPAGLEEGEG